MQLQNEHMAASSSPIYGGGPRRGTASTFKPQRAHSNHSEHIQTTASTFKPQRAHSNHSEHKLNPAR